MKPDHNRQGQKKQAEKQTRDLPSKKLSADRADKVRGGRRVADELPKET